MTNFRFILKKIEGLQFEKSHPYYVFNIWVEYKKQKYSVRVIKNIFEEPNIFHTQDQILELRCQLNKDFISEPHVTGQFERAMNKYLSELYHSILFAKTNSDGGCLAWDDYSCDIA